MSICFALFENNSTETISYFSLHRLSIHPEMLKIIIIIHFLYHMHIKHVH